MNNHYLESVLSKALALSIPSSTEEKKVSRVADTAKSLIENECKKYEQALGAEFGGSFAKGTWLRGDTDIDIFVKMDPSIEESEFERVGIMIGKNALEKYETSMRYSDHPYVESFIDKIRVNVVPCYLVEKGKWKSAADRSPFHTEYIKENLDREKRDQVRLLKKFLKSNRVYGAEIAKAGFSGYVCEVLIAKYGSFEKTLNAISDISPQSVISLTGYDSDIVKGFQSPIVIIDPVDSRRNLGTAISPESVGRFALAARAFLQKPSMPFFRAPTRSTKTANKSLLANVLVVEFRHKYRSPDIIWGQLKRSLNAISKQFEIAEFHVIKDACMTDEKTNAIFVFLLESMSISEFKERRGPEVFRKDDTTSFVKGNLSKSLAMWVDREMRTSALVKRKETDARQFVKNLLLNNIDNSGVTRGIIEDMANGKGVQIYSGKDRKLKGLVKEAVNGLLSTEHRLFR